MFQLMQFDKSAFRNELLRIPNPLPWKVSETKITLFTSHDHNLTAKLATVA